MNFSSYCFHYLWRSEVQSDHIWFWRWDLVFCFNVNVASWFSCVGAGTGSCIKHLDTWEQLVTELLMFPFRMLLDGCIWTYTWLLVAFLLRGFWQMLASDADINRLYSKSTSHWLKMFILWICNCLWRIYWSRISSLNAKCTQFTPSQVWEFAVLLCNIKLWME